MIDSSKNTPSTLIASFVRRTQSAEGRPYLAMAYYVQRLREATGSLATPPDLYSCLDLRRIVSISFDPDTSADGYIQPKGVTYQDGFRLVLNKRAPAPRSRFTMAHEICHTFFYEIVPEIKFAPHPSDEIEERLCNFGAAELLMPAPDLRRRVWGNTPSILALERLAEYYGVSLDAMFIRLRTLRLWGCALSFWYQRSNGVFALERIYGGRNDWEWLDDDPLHRAWSMKATAPVQGRLFLSRADAVGRRWAACFYFQAKRLGNVVSVLWSSDPLADTVRQLALFQRSKRRRNKVAKPR
jgi:IrrE N-terminal-like domain